MPTEPVSQPSEQTIQPNVPPPIIPAAVPPSVRKTNYTVFIVAFIFAVALEAVISYFLFIKIPSDKASLVSATPTMSLLPSPTPTSVLTSIPSVTSPPQVSPTPKKVTCKSEDPMCIFTNIINGFTNGCTAVEVTTTADGAQVTLTISGGENGSCRFQMKGLGVDQDCLFAKENVTATVIKGMMGMDNIPKDPEFINIKAASCK